jgi:hypothetical protein
MLCSKFFVLWVCSWYFDYNTQHGYPILIEDTKKNGRTPLQHEAKVQNLLQEWCQQHQKA